MLKLFTFSTIAFALVIHTILVTAQIFVSRGGNTEVINGIGFVAVILAIIPYAWTLIYFYNDDKCRRRY
jgi:hypothetical protein